MSIFYFSFFHQKTQFFLKPLMYPALTCSVAMWNNMRWWILKKKVPLKNPLRERRDRWANGRYHIISPFEHQGLQWRVYHWDERKATWKKNPSDLRWLYWSLRVARSGEIWGHRLTCCSCNTYWATIYHLLQYLCRFGPSFWSITVRVQTHDMAANTEWIMTDILCNE